jgi:hypothetical protein
VQVEMYSRSQNITGISIDLDNKEKGEIFSF